jgi:hypothetical protein
VGIGDEMGESLDKHPIRLRKPTGQHAPIRFSGISTAPRAAPDKACNHQRRRYSLDRAVLSTALLFLDNSLGESSGKLLIFSHA